MFTFTSFSSVSIVDLECRNYVLLKTEQSTSFAEFSFHFLFIMFAAIVSGYFKPTF